MRAEQNPSQICTSCQAARRKVPDSPVRGEEMEEIKQGSVRGTPETGNGEPLLTALPRESCFHEKHT